MSPRELLPEGGWQLAAAERIATPPPHQRNLLFRAASTIAPWFRRPKVPRVFAVLAKNPLLFWPWLAFASRLMPWGRLPASVREKVILRTAWNTRSRYEWGQHVEIGLQAGLTDDEIVSVSRGPAAFADRHDRALMQACDDLFARAVVSPAAFTVLRERYDDPLLIELLVLVGHYAMLAGFLNTAGTALEPELEAVLEAFHRRVAHS